MVPTFAAELHEVGQILQTLGNHHEGAHGSGRHRIWYTKKDMILGPIRSIFEICFKVEALSFLYYCWSEIGISR